MPHSSLNCTCTGLNSDSFGQVEAQKPAWQAGSSAPLNLRGGRGVSKPEAKKAWALDADAGEELVADELA